MWRCRLCGVACAAMLFSLTMAHGDEIEAPVARILAVQNAMAQARVYLDSGQPRQAVDVLEGQLSRIDGNIRYLALLRDAYVIHLKELRLAGRADEADVIERRLRYLEPASGVAVSLQAPEPVAAPPLPTPKNEEPVLPARPEPSEAIAAPEPSSETEPSARQRADTLILRAEKAFAAQNYTEAAGLFEQAAQLDAAAVAGCAERRGYCLLYGVVEALNAGQTRPSPDVEAQVREAVRLAPNLNEYANDILGRVKEQPKTETPSAPSGDWEQTPSKNVQVFHRGKPELAKLVAQSAERARSLAFETWHGPTTDTWSPTCVIYLHASAERYAADTGKPQASAGHATVKSKGASIIGRRIDLRADDPDLLGSTLAHEMTHVVLSDLFPADPLPRWADEGIAVLAEAAPRIDRYRRTLARLRVEGGLQPLAQLIVSNDYPGPEHVTAFYVQSVSVVNFLAGLKGPKAFAIFLKHAPRYGWETALERHYGIRGFADLQQQWERHAFPSGPVARGGP